MKTAIRIYMTVMAAFPLAFAAWVFQKAGAGPGGMCLVLFTISFLVGRFIAGEEYQRELDSLKREVEARMPKEKP